MKNLYLSLLLMLSSFGLFAQFQHRCGFDHAVQHKNELHPGFKDRADAIFRQAAQYSQLRGASSSYVVPLAVHVVWKNTTENLPECKIIEQVDILNRAYQRMNPDTSNLRSIFGAVAGNPNIQFRLDTIIWKQTSSDFFSGGFFPDISFSDRVKHDSSGGSEAINTSGHLNMWICNLGSSGILGYAYPPAGLANWPADSEAPTPGDEGVVLDYRIIGAEGVYVQQTTTINTRGNTAIHEVGHYLGLRHVWGDGLLSILGIPDCTVDDGVMDTPNCGIPSNYACNLTQNTCDATVTGDLPDMIENFMDYSDEDCQNTLTLGQVNIMHGVLNVERVGLATAPPIHNTIRPLNDALPRSVVLGVNTDNSCTVNTNSYNTAASPSMSACSGANPANDVWFSFEAVSTEVIINVSNIQATTGASTALTYELFSGNCGALQSMGCFSSASSTVSGLQNAEEYFIRVYSNDAGAAQSFNLCLQAAGNVSVNTTALAEAISVFPNPNSGIFTVSFPNVDLEGTMSVKNFLGQQLSNKMSIDRFTENIQVDLSTLANGVYLVEFNLAGERIVKKILVQK
jgi:hypothetical protein